MPTSEPAPAALVRAARRHRRLVALALAVPACALPASASAATVGVVPIGPDPGAPGGEVQSTLAFAAAPGEVNSLTIVPYAGDAILFRDGRNPVTAVSPQCANIDPFTVACRDDVGEAGLEVLLSDGPDILDMRLPAGRRTSVDGGPGDDVISTGASADAIDGGAGNDRIASGRGSDTINGDGFEDAGGTVVPGNDVIDAGPGGGQDVLLYDSAPRGLDIDLEDGVAESPVERDEVTGFEGVRGSDHDDEIRGTDEDEALEGGDGEDRIDGRGGDDVLQVEGEDRVSGGEGRDRVTGTAGAFAGVIDCGPGRDVVEPEPVADEPRRPDYEVRRDCERLVIPTLSAAAEPLGRLDPRLRRRSGGVVPVRFSDLRRRSRTTTMTVRLRTDDEDRRWLGSARIRIPAGSGTVDRTARVALNARGRRMLQPGRTRTVALELSADGFGPVAVSVR